MYTPCLGYRYSYLRIQHVKALLGMHGTCAIVVPLLQAFDVHTLLPLPTGTFLRPRGEGERPVLRREARTREALDRAAVGL